MKMSKKLKIKFWKAERALAMQILEQDGLPEMKNDEIVRIVMTPSLCEGNIYLRGDCSRGDFDISGVFFNTITDRDEYLNKITQAITDELFTGTGELKVGEMCEVRDFENENWQTRKLLAILPKNYVIRFIVNKDEVKDDWVEFRQARPITKRTEPKIEDNGEIITYTWEEK